MCRHIYDWNIVNCDVKQPIQLNEMTIIFACLASPRPEITERLRVNFRIFPSLWKDEKTQIIVILGGDEDYFGKKAKGQKRRKPNRVFFVS